LEISVVLGPVVSVFFQSFWFRFVTCGSGGAWSLSLCVGLLQGQIDAPGSGSWSGLCSVFWFWFCANVAALEILGLVPVLVDIFEFLYRKKRLDEL
jgi:hypothetical protein